MKNIWFKVIKNDIAFKIYLCFTFVLVLTGLLTGIIFIRLYKQNYLRSYTDLLTKQGHTIANRVAVFEKNGRAERFLKYSTYIEEIEEDENTDVWIISDENSQNPLAVEYTNANDGKLTDEMYDVIYNAFKGEVSSNSSYDDIHD